MVKSPPQTRPSAAAVHFACRSVATRLQLAYQIHLSSRQIECCQVLAAFLQARRTTKEWYEVVLEFQACIVVVTSSHAKKPSQRTQQIYLNITLSDLRIGVLSGIPATETVFTVLMTFSNGRG